MIKHIASLTHTVNDRAETVKIAFLREDNLVLLDGRLHSTIQHAQIFAGCPLLVVNVVDNGCFIDVAEVRNVEIPE